MPNNKLLEVKEIIMQSFCLYAEARVMWLFWGSRGWNKGTTIPALQIFLYGPLLDEKHHKWA